MIEEKAHQHSRRSSINETVGTNAMALHDKNRALGPTAADCHKRRNNFVTPAQTAGVEFANEPVSDKAVKDSAQSTLCTQCSATGASPLSPSTASSLELIALCTKVLDPMVQKWRVEDETNLTNRMQQKAADYMVCIANRQSDNQPDRARCCRKWLTWTMRSLRWQR